ncbi:uncharacterized protein LOC127536046 isoform X5 [Acanthochromis polyacanthus]|uniref:uncharacterized protein LOC127536046 isoform X5 n=1 Tax=Acanthochromis polyacanthus TaxID=80966 RepID=UPI0022341CC6|nr:uncharacterized protein LOC127536046 isoform X5 [Acanthochromis polyacanthus]
MVSTIIHKPHGSPAGQCSQSPVGSASSICTWTLDTLHIAHSLSPGPWRQLGVNDVQENMLQIRRWWCLVLLQNFPMLSKEERLQQRKRQREQKKLQENPLVRDAMAAARWCGTRTFKGKISLPQVVTMAKEQRVRAGNSCVSVMARKKRRPLISENRSFFFLVCRKTMRHSVKKSLTGET